MSDPIDIIRQAKAMILREAERTDWYASNGDHDDKKAAELLAKAQGLRDAADILDEMEDKT